MKTRLVVIAILLFMLTVLLSKNDERITTTLLSAINPVKQSYKMFTQNLENKSHSYIFQKESIEKLSRENRILHKQLLEQKHYLEEIHNIYQILPNLTQFPKSSIAIVETISYVKLNSFSQIILTKPKDLQENKLYGIIQNNVVAGIAEIQSNQLYGYLTSDKKCRFSVFIGEKKAPGIAIGEEKNRMLIKFIPKWHDIKKGDKVYTSGLDKIFFANIPVGIVEKIEVQSSYTVAHIKTYSDIFHPQTFFLITNAQATLTEDFDNNQTNTVLPQSSNSTMEELNDTTVTVMISDINHSQIVSSIPLQIDQTQENLIEPETVEEHPTPIKPKRNIRKHKHKTNTFDLF